MQFESKKYKFTYFYNEKYIIYIINIFFVYFYLWKIMK